MVEILNKASNVVSQLEDHAAALAFAWQVIEKDVLFSLNSNKWNGWSATKVGQDIINMYAGRILGLKPWVAVSNYPKTFNFNNIFNPNTMIGVALWGSHQLGFTSARIGRLGGKIAIGAGMGSIFDDPIDTSGNIQNAIPTGNYSSGTRNMLPVGTNVPWTHP